MIALKPPMPEIAAAVPARTATARTRTPRKGDRIPQQRKAQPRLFMNRESLPVIAWAYHQRQPGAIRIVAPHSVDEALWDMVAQDVDYAGDAAKMLLGFGNMTRTNGQIYALRMPPCTILVEDFGNRINIWRAKADCKPVPAEDGEGVWG